MSEKILVTTRLPGDPVVRLRAARLPNTLDIKQFDAPRTATRAQLLEGVRGASAILSQIPDQIDDEVLDAAGESLAVVANFGVGFDNINVASCKARNIIVTNTPGVVTEPTADITWLLILAAARGAMSAERLLRAGKWEGWHPTTFIGKALTGKVLHLVGMGRIAQAVARRAIGWQMEILYTSRTPKAEAEAAPINARRVELEEGLALADVISMHCPLTEETKHLIDARRLALMKPSAIFINTARGPVVDEKALANALASGALYAAGLDVYEREPEVNEALLQLDNVVLLPHLGTSVDETRAQMTHLAVDNIVAVLSGKPPLSPVG